MLCIPQVMPDTKRHRYEFGLPMVVLQEGGYHMGDLAANVTAWLKGLGRIGLGAERLSEPYAT